MSDKEIDEITGVDTTGHEWDGIRELNNPLPRWWLWTFYACIAFSVGYVIYYPSIPLLESSTMGISGTTNRSLLKEEMDLVAQSRQAENTRLAETDLASIQADEELRRYAIAAGSSLFKVYCTQCHGSGATGGPGYPNLNDDDWLWGGDLEAIYTSIAHGIRNTEDDDARFSQMPNFGTDGLLERQQIAQVTNYVLKISNQENDPVLAGPGETVFAENCSSCHGEEGKGGREVGAPNLADAISLYGNTATTIAAQIAKPKHGVMPPWKERLGDAQVKELAIYVHSLGGGEKSASN